MELYDDANAINYIREHIAQETSAKYDDDEFQNVIDMIMDWYEDNDLLDIDVDDDDLDNDREALIDSLSSYIVKTLAKDKGARLESADVKTIVEAELDYEDLISQL